MTAYKTRLYACTLLFLITLSSVAYGTNSKPIKGLASWYGNNFHGKKTASGELFNQNDLTAAHKNIPFGTVLRIHSLETGKQVLVQTTDRGPVSKKLELDLSKQAAKSIGILNKGVAKVIIEKVTDHEGVPLNKENAFYIFDKKNGNKFKTIMLVLKYTNFDINYLNLMKDLRKKNLFNKVVALGPFNSFSEAREVLLDLRKHEPGFDIFEGSTTQKVIYTKPKASKSITANR